MASADHDRGFPLGLVEWFAVEVDQGDAPELHLVGLQDGDLTRCFDVIQSHRPHWSDRLFYIDSERVDVTVAQRPDVAELVAAGHASHACIGADGLTVEGVVLPLVEMFLFRDSVQFFWWPGDDWTAEGVAAFFALLAELLSTAPGSALRPDPRYPMSARESLGKYISDVLGAAGSLDFG